MIIPILILFSFSYVFAEPYLVDSNFVVEEYVRGLAFPTSMHWIDNDLLVLEKNSGNVYLVREGKLQTEPVLHVDVDNRKETGLLGITSDESFVYLYFTAVNKQDKEKNEVIGNRIFKYSWDGKKLDNQKLLKELPVDPRVNSEHSGGAMTTGLDGMVYAVIGDTDRRGLSQNLPGDAFDDSSIIVKVNYDPSILKPSESENPTDHYFAIGIRNSFGLAIDPITGNLWDTENGITDFDEINLVQPKQNSGWIKIQGPAKQSQIDSLPNNGFHYSDPEFSWSVTVAPTGLTFVESNSFDNYKNYIFVADFNTGSIYKFKLNPDRTGLVFHDPSLKDLILNPSDSFHEIIFGTDFNVITDLEFGPDGLLYILTLHNGGTIYRIVPTQDPEEISIPSWFKNNAKWWDEGLIQQTEFLNSIEFLIEDSIILVPSVPPFSKNQNPEIPPIIKEKIIMWVNGDLNDTQLASSFQFLLLEGILKVDKRNCDNSPEIKSNYSECNLSGKIFSDSDIKFSSFESSDLSGTDFSKSDLTLSNFNSANLYASDFSETRLKFASFQNAELNYSDFSGAFITFAQFQGANLSNSILKNTYFTRSSLDDADLSYADLSESNLSFTRIKNANLENAKLSKTDLFVTRIQDSNLNGVDLSNSNLKLTRIINSTLNNVNFLNCSAIGVKFQNSDLTNSTFRNCDLSKADFSNVNLSGVDFTNTILSDAIFANSNLEDALGGPFVGCKKHPLCQ